MSVRMERLGSTLAVVTAERGTLSRGLIASGEGVDFANNRMRISIPRQIFDYEGLLELSKLAEELAIELANAPAQQ